MLEAFPLLPEVVTTNGGTNSTEFNARSAIRDIVTGEDIHGSRRGLSMFLANHGVPSAAVLSIIEELITTGYECGNIEADRYRERMANNEQVVMGAYARISNEIPEYDLADSFAPTLGGLYTKMPELPNGSGLAVLVSDIMSNMFHPVYEVAVPLAMHLVTVFGGGCYHLGNVTATRKRAICMSSGSGKDIVTNYMHACIKELNDARAREFVGIQSFTPRTVHAELKSFRCRSYVVSEAGISGMSETGDVAAMRGYMLELLSSKRGRPLSIKATVADIKQAKEDKVGLDVHGPVAGIIAESTIEAYIKLLRITHSDVTGMMAREELIFPEPDYDYNKSNPLGFNGVGDTAMGILKPMAQRFLDSKHITGVENKIDEMFTAVNTDEVQDMLVDQHKRCCTLRNTNKEARSIVETQYSRLFEKIKCTSMILAIADSPTTLPTVKPWHVQYAVDYHDALVGTVLAHLDGGALGDVMELCIRTLATQIKRYPERKKDIAESINVPKRIVRKAWFSSVLDVTKCKDLKTLAEQSYFGKVIDARNTVIREACDRGLIERVPGKRETYILAKIKV